MGAMMEKEIMTITIQIEGHPVYTNDFYGDVKEFIYALNEGSININGIFKQSERRD